MEQGLLIGEVAARSGLSRKALRLYESRGVLPPPRREPSGYRRYPTDVLGLLAFVGQARRLGLTLSEIKHIVALRRSGSAPCVHLRALPRSVRTSRQEEVTANGKGLALPAMHRMLGSRHRRRHHPHWRGREHRRPQENGVERPSC